MCPEGFLEEASLEDGQHGSSRCEVREHTPGWGTSEEWGAREGPCQRAPALRDTRHTHGPSSSPSPKSRVRLRG